MRSIKRQSFEHVVDYDRGTVGIEQQYPPWLLLAPSSFLRGYTGFSNRFIVKSQAFKGFSGGEASSRGLEHARFFGGCREKHNRAT